MNTLTSMFYIALAALVVSNTEASQLGVNLSNPRFEKTNLVLQSSIEKKDRKYLQKGEGSKVKEITKKKLQPNQISTFLRQSNQPKQKENSANLGNQLKKMLDNSKPQLTSDKSGRGLGARSLKRAAQSFLIKKERSADLKQQSSKSSSEERKNENDFLNYIPPQKGAIEVVESNQKSSNKSLLERFSYMKQSGCKTEIQRQELSFSNKKSKNSAIKTNSHNKIEKERDKLSLFQENAHFDALNSSLNSKINQFSDLNNEESLLASISEKSIARISLNEKSLHRNKKNTLDQNQIVDRLKSSSDLKVNQFLGIEDDESLVDGIQEINSEKFSSNKKFHYQIDPSLKNHIVFNKIIESQEFYMNKDEQRDYLDHNQIENTINLFSSIKTSLMKNSQANAAIREFRFSFGRIQILEKIDLFQDTIIKDLNCGILAFQNGQNIMHSNFNSLIESTEEKIYSINNLYENYINSIKEDFEIKNQERLEASRKTDETIRRLKARFS